MALITKEDVKAFLQYEHDTIDGVIDSNITIEEDYLKNVELNGTTFDATSAYNTETDYYNGDGSCVLLVDKYPIRAVTTIHLNSDTPRSYGASDLVSADNILDVDFDCGLIRLDGLVFTQGVKTVKVVYTAGWKTTDAPKAFKQALIERVAANIIEGLGGVNAVEADNFFYKPDKLRKTANRRLEEYVVVR